MTIDGELLERDLPLAALGQRLHGLQRADAKGACVLVHGEAGVGKTSLLRRLRQDHADAAHWLWGACEPLLSPPPWGPLIDMLDQLPPLLAQAVRSGAQGQQVLAGMLQRLRERQTPTVLVVEDVHWADSATLDLLRYLSRRIDSTRALLVLSYRDDAASTGTPLLGVLGALPTACTLRLPLAPLSRQTVHDWARRAGRDPQAVYTATGGNPFFVAELLSCHAALLPATVCDAVLARAAQLPADARALLDLASVVPSFVEPTLLDALLPGAGLALRACADVGLLRSDAQGVRFRHELVRQVIEQALSADAARSLHSAVYQALTQMHGSAARLVHHAERAGLTQALRLLAPRAARSAAQASAHHQAAALYGLALLHGQGLCADERAALLEAHADECLITNRVNEAMAASLEALAQRRASGDRRCQGINLRRLARLESLRSGQDAAMPHALAAVAALQDAGADRELAMAYATVAQLHLLGPDSPQAQQWAQRGLALAEPLGDAEALAFTLNSAACATLRTADDGAGWQQLQRSLTLALDNGLDDHATRAYLNLLALTLLHRRYGDTHLLCAEALLYSEARGLDVYAAKLRLRRAHAWLETGRWADAQAELAQIDQQAGISALEREQSQYGAMLLALRRGAAQTQTRTQPQTYWREMLAGSRRLGFDPWYAPQSVCCAEAAWLAGDQDAVERVARQALPAALQSGQPWFIGQLLCWLGRIGRLGSVRPALQLQAPLAPPCAAELAGDLDRAAAAWLQRDCRYEQALVLMGGTAEQLHRALAILDDLGAAPAAALARRRLRALGERQVARGAYRHARSDPLGLTGREREVLDLLHQRLSNRAIAKRLSRSERTVENHVAALLAKLGASNRAEALDCAMAQARRLATQAAPN